jgi:hypothetical protein
MKSRLLFFSQANLVDKLSEAGGVGQVDVGVGLHAVTVAAS